MTLPVVFPRLLTPQLLALEFFLFFFLVTLCLAFVVHAHFVKPLTSPLHYMEDIDGDDGVRKTFLDNASHRVGKIHGDFFDGQPRFQRNPLQHIRDSGYPCPLYGSYQGAFLPMSVLVDQEREQVVSVHALVYTEVRPHVMGQQDIGAGMVFLIPVIETAQMLLVVAPQRLAVYFIEPPQRVGR